MLGFTTFHPTHMAAVLGSPRKLGDRTISNCCWVSLRFTQPTDVGFHPTHMAAVLGSPRKLGDRTISNCCWVSLRFTQPTDVGFHPTYMAGVLGSGRKLGDRTFPKWSRLGGGHETQPHYI
ncbi:hypothetical protein [Limnospira platensis]|uniref:hypothetical protein n=1 Tax=Limnospira platensis TaxID=118562 RepID=UPI0025708419